MTNNIQNSELNGLITKTELLSILECPVCNEIPLPPIYQCIKGHSVCKNCKPKLKECPTCRGSFSETRNYTVEQLVLAANHSCPYKDDGCLIELRGELMENHMKNCPYRHRTFICPWFGKGNCSADVLRLTLAKDHVRDNHLASSSTGPTAAVHHGILFTSLTGEGSLRRLKDTNCKWDPCAIEFDGKTFFVLTFAMNQTICFSVLCVSSEEDAQKYRVKIICQSDKEVEIQWTVPVRSIMKGTELMNTETRHNVIIPSWKRMYNTYLPQVILYLNVKRNNAGNAYCTRSVISNDPLSPSNSDTTN